MGESSTVLRSKELSRHQCVGEGVAGSKPDNTNPGLRPKRAVPAVRVQSGLGGARYCEIPENLLYYFKVKT